MAIFKKNQLILIVAAIAFVVSGALYFAARSASSAQDNAVANRQSQTQSATNQVQTKNTDAIGNRQPTSQQIAGDTNQEVVLTLRTNSTVLVNTVQAAIKYPADALRFESLKTGSVFTSEAATDSSSPGTIRLARSIQAASNPVSGDQIVATVTFKKLKPVDPLAVVTIDQAQSMLVSSDGNQNILGTASGALKLGQ